MPSTNAPSDLPPNLPVSLAFDDPIDLKAIAGGDIIRATVKKAMIAARSSKVLIAKGAEVRGRVLNVERRLDPRNHLLLAISFDVVETPSGASPLHLVLDRRLTMSHGSATLQENSSRWPEITLVLPDVPAIPRGFESNWLTARSANR